MKVLAAKKSGNVFEEIANKACDFLGLLNYALKYFHIGKNCSLSFEGDLMDHDMKAISQDTLNARTKTIIRYIIKVQSSHAAQISACGLAETFSKMKLSTQCLQRTMNRAKYGCALYELISCPFE